MTTSSATLEADIDPEGKAANYRFEYGTADCLSNPCASLPEPEGKLKAGSEAVRVSAPVSGLSPGTIYHFRVLAHSSQETSESADRLFSPYLPEPVFGPCPANEALRVGKPSAKLPDCRAYEQASPVDKGGVDVGGTYLTVKSSPSGEAVSFYTASGLPQSSGAQEPPMQVARRGASDWTTHGFLVPEGFGQRSTVLGWTPDFSQVFNQVTIESFGQPNRGALLDLQPGGSIAEVVPYGDADLNFNFAGASADGSEVFFEAAGRGAVPLTPEAVPGQDNLYVWDRGMGDIGLVGVLPDAECDPPPCAPPGGSSNGAIARRYTQDQHAVSTDGQSAYFTAGDTGQLYRRTNPISQTAQTVRVSTTEKTNGHGEGGADAAGASPAAFMAATPDGSKAFFTSAEKLTDDATTGPEPTVPPSSIASSDLEGNPSSVDFGFMPQRNVSALAIDGGFVFWIDPETHAIGRATLNGNNTPTDVRPEFIANPGNPQYLAADGEHLYWTNFDETELTQNDFSKLGTSTIGRADLDGSQVDLDFIAGVERPAGIAAYEGHLYWASNAPPRPPAGEPSKPYEGHAAIARATLNGDGSATEVEPFFVKDGDIEKDALAVGAGGIYWGSHGSNGLSPLLHHTGLNGEDEQRYCVSTGGTFCEIEGDRKPPAIVGIALSASHVYWIWQGGDRLGRAKLDLTDPENEFIEHPGHPRGLAIEGEHLYWSANQEAVPNPGRDLYRWEADKPASERLTDLTVDHGDENGAEVRGVLGASEDGSYLYFVANGVPDGVTGSPNLAGESASQGDCPETLGFAQGTCNLYLSHEGEVEFIARTEDQSDWTVLPLDSGREQKTSRVSADGRTLLFSSRRQLTAYDNEGKRELYRYRVGEGLLCVSCNPTGASPGSVGVRGIEIVLLPTALPAATLSRSLSADGNRVFFESTDALVAADTDGADGCPLVGSQLQRYPSCQDVYEWEAKGEGSCESEAQNGGCLYLLSTGKSSRPSFFADASTDGDNALLVTASGLVGQDGDQLMDVYDARVDGGLAAQSETKGNCEAEACKPGASSSPGFDSPASAGFVGPPNPNARKPKARCAKGKREARVKGKSRCVAKKHKRHRKSAKAGRPR